MCIVLEFIYIQVSKSSTEQDCFELLLQEVREEGGRGGEGRRRSKGRKDQVIEGKKGKKEEGLIERRERERLTCIYCSQLMKMTEYKTTVLSLSQMMVDRLIEQLLSLDELSGTVHYRSPLSIIITNTCSTCACSLSCFYYGTWEKILRLH